MPPDNSILEDLTQNVWRFDHRRPPPRLAHYTSLATLGSILRSRELWFSNPLYMNDWEELRFGMREGAAALRESGAVRAACGDCHDELLLMFDRLYSEFESKHALEIYILFLSEHDDGDFDGPLSMWRGYGERGQGAALLFDTAQFARYSHLPLVTAPVEYASAERRRARLQELATSAAQVV